MCVIRQHKVFIKLLKVKKKSQNAEVEVLLSTGPISAYLWRDLLMGPLSIVINSGYLLVMMEMPGIFNLFNASQCIFLELYIAHSFDTFVFPCVQVERHVDHQPPRP